MKRPRQGLGDPVQGHLQPPCRHLEALGPVLVVVQGDVVLHVKPAGPWVLTVLHKSIHNGTKAEPGLVKLISGTVSVACVIDIYLHDGMMGKPSTLRCGKFAENPAAQWAFDSWQSIELVESI